MRIQILSPPKNPRQVPDPSCSGPDTNECSGKTCSLAALGWAPSAVAFPTVPGRTERGRVSSSRSSGRRGGRVLGGCVRLAERHNSVGFLNPLPQVPGARSKGMSPGWGVAVGALSPHPAPCPRWSLRVTHGGGRAAELDAALSPSGDGDIVNNMHEPDPDLLAGESAEYETEDSVVSPIPMGPPSPFPTSEDFTPKEGSPYEAPVYIPEDIPIPPDVELRESSIPGAGLGIWAKKRMEIGARFGPYMGAPRATWKEADFGWEVSIPV